MKNPTSIWTWQHRRLSIMKIMVLLWSTSMEKDSNIAPSLFFSHFFVWAFSIFLASFLSFFLFFVRSLIPTCGGIIVSIILSSLGQCSNNDDHHTFIFSYNSIITTRYLEQNMTLYECLRRCTGMCNDSWVTCMKELWTVALPQYDVNYMIMLAIWQWWSVP